VAAKLPRGKRFGKRSWPGRFGSRSGWRWRRNRAEALPGPEAAKKDCSKRSKALSAQPPAQVLHSSVPEGSLHGNQFLRLKGLANQFIRFHGNRFVATLLLTTPDISTTGVWLIPDAA